MIFHRESNRPPNPSPERPLIRAPSASEWVELENPALALGARKDATPRKMSYSTHLLIRQEHAEAHPSSGAFNRWAKWSTVRRWLNAYRFSTPSSVTT